MQASGRACIRFHGEEGEVPRGTSTLADFWDTTYLPWAEKNLRPSTVSSYADLWQRKLKPRSDRHLSASSSPPTPRSFFRVSPDPSGATPSLPISVSRTSEWKVAADEPLDHTYKAQGISGTITGFGFDDIVFDNLFKNGQEATSETKRGSIIDGVVSAGMSRLMAAGHRDSDAGAAPSGRHDRMAARHGHEVPASASATRSIRHNDSFTLNSRF